MNNFNASTKTNVCHSEMQTDTLGGNSVECMKATNLKLEEGESYGKCHRSKIPIRIKDWSHKTTSILEKGPEDIIPRDENIKIQIDWIIRRLEHIERILLSDNKMTE